MFCRFILTSNAFKLVVDIAGDTEILHCLGKGPSPLPSRKKIQLKQLKSLGAWWSLFLIVSSSECPIHLSLSFPIFPFPLNFYILLRCWVFFSGWWYENYISTAACSDTYHQYESTRNVKNGMCSRYLKINVWCTKKLDFEVVFNKKIS